MSEGECFAFLRSRVVVHEVNAPLSRMLRHCSESVIVALSRKHIPLLSRGKVYIRSCNSWPLQRLHFRCARAENAQNEVEKPAAPDGEEPKKQGQPKKKGHSDMLVLNGKAAKSHGNRNVPFVCTVKNVLGASE